MDGDIHIPLKKVETASIWPTFEHIMANLQSAVSIDDDDCDSNGHGGGGVGERQIIPP